MATKDMEITFNWAEIAALLFQSRGIESGLWRIGVTLRLTGLNSGPSDSAMLPSALVAFEKIGLLPVKSPDPMVVDASKALVASSAHSGGKRKATAELTSRARPKVAQRAT